MENVASGLANSSSAWALAVGLVALVAGILVWMLGWERPKIMAELSRERLDCLERFEKISLHFTSALKDEREMYREELRADREQFQELLTTLGVRA